MKTIKALFGVFVVVAMVYLSMKILPPYYANYQFQDEIQNQSELMSYTQKSEQEIRDGIVKKARDLDISITGDQVKVQRSGANLAISVDYSVHIDVPVYPFDLHFTPSGKNKAI